MVRTNFYISHLHADWGCGPSSCVSFPFLKEAEMSSKEWCASRAKLR